MNRLRVFLAALTCVMALGACQKPVSFQATDITGASFAKSFALTDHTGTERSLADFTDKLVVVFFGFVNCPDVCPTTMIEWKGAMDELGPLAEQVQVLFITVDPERDSQELLAQYVPAFDKRFLGLRGTLAQTKEVASEFKVYFAKVPGTTEDTYTIEHTSATYVFDKSGKVRLMVRNGVGPKVMAQDLKQLIDG